MLSGGITTAKPTSVALQGAVRKSLFFEHRLLESRAPGAEGLAHAAGLTFLGMGPEKRPVRPFEMKDPHHHGLSHALLPRHV